MRIYWQEMRFIMKRIIIIYCLVLLGAKYYIAHTQNSTGYSKKIKPYVDFLTQQNISAQDYIFNLFEQYDVVIICERHHAERTQYDFFYDIVTDPRFRTMGGSIYTEIYSEAGTEMYKRLTFSDHIQSAEAIIDSIHFDTHFWPSWDMRNMRDFLLRLYMFNQQLSIEERIRWIGSCPYINWNEIQTKENVEVWKKIKYDLQIAQNIYQDFNDHGKKKSLVIMNYRHAFMNNSWEKGENNKIGPHVAAILNYYLPGKVANIWLNDVVTAGFPINKPILDGKLDAAFKVLDNPSLGFDIKNSPLENILFEPYPQRYYRHNLTFNDVFHGYVFYNPVEDFRLNRFFPEYYSVEKNKKEILRRYQLIKKKSTGRKLVRQKKVTDVPYHKLSWIERKINKWIE